MTKEGRIYRSDRSPYIVFGIMWFIPSFLVTAMIWNHPLKTLSWLPPIVSLCLGLLIYLWISAYRLEIDNISITYSSLFGGQNKVLLSDIASARLSRGPQLFSGARAPVNRIRITMKKDIEPERIFINSKVFSRSAVFDLKQTLLPMWRTGSGTGKQDPSFG